MKSTVPLDSMQLKLLLSPLLCNSQELPRSTPTDQTSSSSSPVAQPVAQPAVQPVPQEPVAPLETAVIGYLSLGDAALDLHLTGLKS